MADGPSREQVAEAVRTVICDEMGLPAGHAKAVSERVAALLAVPDKNPVLWEGDLNTLVEQLDYGDVASLLAPMAQAVEQATGKTPRVRVQVVER